MTAQEALIDKEVSVYLSGEDKEGDKEKYMGIFAEVNINLVDPKQKAYYALKINLNNKVSNL
jgi:hypothetical protein